MVTYVINNELEMKAWSYNSTTQTVEEGGKKKLQNWERKQVEGEGKFYNYKAIA